MWGALNSYLNDVEGLARADIGGLIAPVGFFFVIFRQFFTYALKFLLLAMSLCVWSSCLLACLVGVVGLVLCTGLVGLGGMMSASPVLLRFLGCVAVVGLWWWCLCFC